MYDNIYMVTNRLQLPYVSMYVKQDNVKPSFVELLKRQVCNQRGSHQKECVNRRQSILYNFVVSRLSKDNLNQSNDKHDTK